MALSAEGGLGGLRRKMVKTQREGGWGNGGCGPCVSCCVSALEAWSRTAMGHVGDPGVVRW